MRYQSGILRVLVWGNLLSTNAVHAARCMRRGCGDGKRRSSSTLLLSSPTAPDAEHVREIKARFETTLHVCDAELQVVLVHEHCESADLESP